jgi:uncharacterized Zn-binding protein involved in type VI secretion
MGTVYANGRSVAHKGDGETNVCAPPDACKTPSPGGPVPVPYVNVACDADLANGTKQVKVEGNPAAIEGAEISTSTGDEPGTVGGLVSSKFKGKAAWLSASDDVLFEGKGVVRFLDTLQHNGNTYNSAFIEKGQTGLAYGDDEPCEACTKGLESHRVHETDGVVGFVGDVFRQLEIRFKPQGRLIKEYVELRAVRAEEARKIDERAEAMDRPLTPLRVQQKALTSQIKQADAEGKRKIGPELARVNKEIAAKEAEIKKMRAEANLQLDKHTARMNVINAELAALGPVLRKDEDLGTYAQGYMIGVCVCKCPRDPKRLAACSGEASPGFIAAVGATPFTRVDSFKMSDRQVAALAKEGRRKWECAAPKILQAGGAGGHKIAAISERWYSPADGVTVSVRYSHTAGSVTQMKEQEFQHGESVPSCETCQKNVPEMVCDNDKECP